ncbi:hypothetical protein D621_01305 [beta proteobacterium AAP51]|nr:hypothetical protein D621_01305 [beta proteobacterium AAP51]
MDKLLWVLAPLVLAGGVVGVLAWRGRLPSRTVLNAAFSLLLLVYLLVTAGLGIFWVAHQHLPVFDWHYVFGYAMLVLVAVHLAFNFRMLWHTLKRRQTPGTGAAGAGTLRPAGPARPRVAAGVARRPWLGAFALLGMGTALGTAYWIGLRQGRTELRVVAGGGATPTDAVANAQAAAAVVEAFHEFSSHSRSGVFRRAASSDWDTRPPPFKALPAATQQALPPPLKARAEGLLTRQGLSTLLWHTAGISLERGGIVFRTAPSSGALFAAEFYLAVRAAPGIAPGLWHYQPQHQALALLRAGEPGPALLPAGAPAALLATALWRRSGHKYGDRGYRYVLADLGHALENTRQVAAALRGSATLLPQFDEAALAALLGIDEQQEGVLAQVLLFGAPVQLQALGPAAQVPVQAGPAALGVTEAIHRATSLRGATAWTASTVPAAPSTAVATAQAAPDPLPLIAARRSHRRFSSQPLGAVPLQQVLVAMTTAPAQLSTAVRVHVLTLTVEGHTPAAWRWDARSRRLLYTHALAARTARAQARAAALGQDVVGDAAAVLVLTLDRAAFAADPAGAARGYRHAFIEAGLLGERLYLQAQALGLGACAVGAFYDDEAAALLGVTLGNEWVVHFAALGVLNPQG